MNAFRFIGLTGLLATALCAASASAETAAPAKTAAPSEVAIPFSRQWDLTSTANGAIYRIFVSEPVEPAPPGGYPIFYVLDGNGYFGSATESERLQELGGQIRGALIVGIGYPFCTCDPEAGMKAIATRRVTDFTPVAPPDKQAKIARQMGGAPTGGADAFYRFIEEDLQPRLAATYSVNKNDRALFGHSLGGLFVLDTLFKHPGAFRSYIAASPVISWGDGEVLRRQPAFAQWLAQSSDPPRILITAGSLEQTVLPISLPPGVSQDEYARSIAEMKMVTNVRRLSKDLARLRSVPGYSAGLRIFENETHTGVVPTAISAGLSFALSR